MPLDLQTIKVKVAIQKEKLEETRSKIELQEKKLQALTNEEALSKEALFLAKLCLEETLEKKVYIEKLVSSALSTVFSEDYEFVLELQYDSDDLLKGIKPRIKVSGGEFDDPLDSFGAGAAVVINLCFRVAILLLTNETAPILIMDEPLANLALDLQPQITAFIEETCKATGIQLIMITHTPNTFGKVIKVEKRRGISHCIELS